MRLSALFCLILLLALGAQPRVKTTQSNLRTANILVEAIPATTADSTTHTVADSTTTIVDQNLITLRGFNKRANDAKESFLITNNAKHRIANVRVTFRYTTLDGAMIHERNVTIPVSLNAGETKMAEVKTFDVQHLFYYYAGPVPRKNATPFKVAFKLLGYDIPVGQ
ncbi:MAG: hypothetical protein J5565_03145 [Muribaculaceae bacterium]|nr:hypothetical protein [Muribaculaceae bacterium]